MSRRGKKKVPKTRVALVSPSSSTSSASRNVLPVFESATVSAVAKELLADGLQDIINIVDASRRRYEQGDYSEALRLFNEALAINPTDEVLRRERDKCKLMLGVMIIPDLFQEPEEKRKMTQVQMIAYWRNQSEEQKQKNKNSEYFSCFFELANSVKATAEQETLVGAYQSLYGWGGAMRDEEFAVEMFKMVINSNNDLTEAEAKYALALILIYGERAVRNELEGLRLLEYVAQMNPNNPQDTTTRGRRVGVAEAQFALGVYHFEGAAANKPETSYQIAAFWFEKARGNGHGPAAAFLGYMHFKGIGLPASEYFSEMLYKDALRSTKFDEACIYLIHLYIQQMETSNAYKYVNEALELENERIKDIAQRLKRIVDVRHADRKRHERRVDKYEKEHGEHAVFKQKHCFRDRVYRADHGPRCIEKVQQVFDNCQGKFSVQIGTFNEFVIKGGIQEDTFVEMITHEYLDDLIWKSALGSLNAISIMELLYYYSGLLNLLGEAQDDLGVFARNRELAESLVNLLYRVLEYEPFYLKWQHEHVQLLYKALNVVASAKYTGDGHGDGHFKHNLDLGLGMIAALVDSSHEGNRYLINAWTFYGEDAMPSRALAEAYYKVGDYNRAYIVLEEALERIPTHLNYLLIQGMACLRNGSDILMGEYDRKLKAISCFEKFLNGSRKDHPKAPEVYYILGKYYYEIYMLNQKSKDFSIEVVKYFLALGNEAEKAQLKCFLPYKSEFRRFLEEHVGYDCDQRKDCISTNSENSSASSPRRRKHEEGLVQMVQNIVNQTARVRAAKGLEEKKTDRMIGTSSMPENSALNVPEEIEKPILLAFTRGREGDNERKNLIVDFRRQFKEAIDRKEEKIYVYVNLNIPYHQVSQPISFGDQIEPLRPINFRDMTVYGDWRFENRLLWLTVIDEVLTGFGMNYIHLIAEDVNKDVMHVHIYCISQDFSVQDNFGFGCKFGVLHPYVKEGRVVEIVSPDSIVYSGESLQTGNFCRYCLKRNATMICSRCKWATYCNRECQKSDWNIMKHKWICHSNPFWNRSLWQSR